MPLTDREIRNTKGSTKRIRLFDERGLYLEVSPSGRKWWRFKYRFEDKEKRLSLGVYPEVSLKAARDRRDDARKLVRDGADPAASKRSRAAGEQADTFKAVALEWFDKFSPGWAPAHASRIGRLFERDIYPWLGPKPIAEISAPELLAAIRRIEKRNALDTAHRAIGNCSQVFRYAVATGRTNSDPTANLRGALPPVRGTHLAATTDPKRLAEILRAMEGYQGTFSVACALRLAPLVFVRPGELRHAEWKHIDLDGCEWRYIASKTSTPHVVPLSRQAVGILRELHPLTGSGSYVFPSARSTSRPMSDNAVLAAMRRLGIAKEEMSGHGFRAVARTILDEVLGVRPDFIEHQLAHAVRDPNGRAYNRTAHLMERHKMMQLWSDYLEGLKTGRSHV